jgi:hypothetical protein
MERGAQFADDGRVDSNLVSFIQQQPRLRLSPKGYHGEIRATPISSHLGQKQLWIPGPPSRYKVGWRQPDTEHAP